MDGTHYSDMGKHLGNLEVMASGFVFVGIITCSMLAFVNLSKGHPHFDESPLYPYFHIRNKEFPWGSIRFAF